MRWWDRIRELSSTEFWGSPAWSWALGGIVAAALFLALLLLRTLLSGRLKRLAEKTRTGLDDLFLDLAGRTWTPRGSSPRRCESLWGGWCGSSIRRG